VPICYPSHHFDHQEPQRATSIPHSLSKAPRSASVDWFGCRSCDCAFSWLLSLPSWSRARACEASQNKCDRHKLEVPLSATANFLIGTFTLIFLQHASSPTHVQEANWTLSSSAFLNSEEARMRKSLEGSWRPQDHSCCLTEYLKVLRLFQAFQMSRPMWWRHSECRSRCCWQRGGPAVFEALLRCSFPVLYPTRHL